MHLFPMHRRPGTERIAMLLLAVMPAGRTLLAQASPGALPASLAVTALQRAIVALNEVKYVRYDVRMEPGSAPQPNSGVSSVTSSGAYAAHTAVVAAVGSPLRYRATLQSDDALTREQLVSDGSTVRGSADGEVSELGNPRAMINRASANTLPTMALFDPETYRGALNRKNLAYAGRDEVDGDLCDVVVSVTLNANNAGGNSEYYWISVRTGLPRARRRIGSFVAMWY